MIDLVARQIARCTSINSFNQLHIALENRITPQEFRDIAEFVSRDHATTPAARWAIDLATQLRGSGKESPERYTRRRLKPNLFLYTGASRPEDKTLAICFTGRSRRLMMPITTFLQHLPADEIDVLLLYRHHGGFYVNGLPGLAKSFSELIGVLAETIEPFGYRRIVTYGTSAGAIPAILAALYLDCDAGIAIAPGSLTGERWNDLPNEPRLQRILADSKDRPRLIAHFSQEHSRDRSFAKELAAALPVTLSPQAGPPVHGVTTPYLRAGTLRGFLSSVLLGDGPAPTVD